MYNPNEDPYFKKFLLNKDLAEDSIKTYANCAKVWYNILGKTIEETYKEIKPLQRDMIIDNYIIKYNPNDSIIKDYFDIFLSALLNEGKADSTIKFYIKVLRLILKDLEIELPKAPKIKVKKKKKNIVLAKEDIKYIFSISDIHYTALYCFLASTGIRISDAAKFSINDWLASTYDYHHCNTLDEFMEKDHKDMIGYWEFYPKKTVNSSNFLCKVCNTPESNEYIKQSIYERIRTIESKNKIHNTNISLAGEDPLFAVQKGYYKTRINREAVVVTSIKKNRKLQEKLKRDYITQYENGEINSVELDKLLKKRPKFHANALRHFFITTIRAYCSNRDISLKMEAHTSDIQTDENYVGESKELFSKDMIKKHYLEIINHLTFSVEIDPLELSEIERVRKENESLKEENIIIKNNIDMAVNDKISEVLAKYGF